MVCKKQQKAVCVCMSVHVYVHTLCVHGCVCVVCDTSWFSFWRMRKPWDYVFM